ncbi:MAG: glycolate oxidase subunit GlcE [Gammaproteobacteria bacterium]
MSDELHRLVDAVRKAHSLGRGLEIRGAGTKAFLTPRSDCEVLDVSAHSGVINHQPTELTITARAGTRLRDIAQLLAEHGQRLPFEPPFVEQATLGGAISAGLSGPRRPWDGAARDAVLGVTLVNGEGRHLRFGGEVMKNVAGYDVSRLVCGAYGALGVLTSVSLRVLPIPPAERTRCFELDRDQALAQVNAWARTALPISATYHHGGQLRVRLSGSAEGVEAAARELGGTELAEADAFWTRVRDQKAEAFQSMSLWRCSVMPAAPYPAFDGAWITEWAGAQRWYLDVLDAVAAFEQATAHGGHASRWRGGGVLHQPLEPVLAKLHQRIKEAFDPKGVLNPQCTGVVI